MRIPRILIPLLLLFSVSAHAQGTLPVSLTQQFSFTGCTTAANVCGTPLAGGLLYFYQVGTVATRQNSFQDTALSIQNPWPLTLDANGRIPAFYLANGSVHVRLTDASGVVQFDYPSALVIGPSSGSGGGAAIDPTTIMATGDIKFRPTGEILTGWARLNGQTIGNVSSGASLTGAQYQALFIYLWSNCPDAHCPVVGGRGANGLADFSANKQLTLMDWRGRIPVGLDDMGNSAAGRLLASNVTSGGGDGVTTPNATGGEANHTLTLAQAPTGQTTMTDPGHVHAMKETTILFGSSGGFTYVDGLGAVGPVNTNSATTGITLTDHAGGQAHNVMNPFMLGTWYIKL
jgi:hypothetical protein